MCFIASMFQVDFTKSESRFKLVLRPIATPDLYHHPPNQGQNSPPRNLARGRGYTRSTGDPLGTCTYSLYLFQPPLKPSIGSAPPAPRKTLGQKCLQSTNWGFQYD